LIEVFVEQNNISVQGEKGAPCSASFLAVETREHRRKNGNSARIGKRQILK
jgi:hypothetical protein